MSYVSDHALYGVGHYGSLGADDSAQWGSYMQTQANAAASKLGLAKVAVDGKPGAKTLTLLKAIYEKTKMVVAQDPITTIADMKANCKVVGDFIRYNILPAIKSSTSVAFQPIDIVGKVPATAAVADKTASTAPTYSVAPTKKKKSSPSFFTATSLSFGMVPNWLVLAGGGALVFFLTRGKKSAPAAAAAASVPAVPKGV